MTSRVTAAKRFDRKFHQLKISRGWFENSRFSMFLIDRWRWTFSFTVNRIIVACLQLHLRGRTQWKSRTRGDVVREHREVSVIREISSSPAGSRTSWNRKHAGGRRVISQRSEWLERDGDCRSLEASSGDNKSRGGKLHTLSQSRLSLLSRIATATRVPYLNSFFSLFFSFLFFSLYGNVQLCWIYRVKWRILKRMWKDSRIR